MKIKNRLPAIAFIISASATLISVIVRCILTLTLLDTAYGVYEHGSTLPKIYHLLLAAMCIFFLLLSFKAPKASADFGDYSSDLTFFLSCALGFMMFGYMIVSGYYLYKNYLVYLYALTIADLLKELSFVTELVGIILALPSAVYFFVILKRQPNQRTAVAFASYFPILWCASRLFAAYFDTSTLTISPNKLIGIMALLSAMAAFLTDSRMHLGCTSVRMSITLLSIAPILLLTSSIPNILLGGYLSIGTTDSITVYIIEALLGLYFLSRLAAYVSCSFIDPPVIKPAAKPQPQEENQ